jgi:hypothetical protein
MPIPSEQFTSGPSRRGFIGAVSLAGGAATLSSIAGLRSPSAAAAVKAPEAQGGRTGSAVTPSSNAGACG